MLEDTTPVRASDGVKVSELFALFWVVKLLTTSIGESSADFMGTHSIALAGIVGVGGFFLALRWQLRASEYHPVRYWITVLMVAVFGTMIADGPHVALGTPYYVDSIVYFAGLIALLTWWRRSEGTLSVHSITTPRRERFYWGTVLLTFGLGTALGDTTAEDMHLGFLASIAIFAVLIIVPLVMWKLGANAVAMFWAAYVVTRPLGASVADYFAYKYHGPLAGDRIGTGPVTAVGLAAFVLLVGWLAVSHRRLEREAQQEPALHFGRALRDHRDAVLEPRA